ncbi:CoB--CoM heterodisulfide reductase iron-sulfur subunit B family protein [Lyngbya confervoides]|uniref:CoB--CoM heterodisulfide reductase iron-sulfur subunit B family protein n=1 Tax=Lyngbya confervoides BDU141951 TaxID=1574623 RepID=A0ABD4T1P9_9CYAN|nr:CoB--CoM heterodisulfide reductase iron-sulfur subunit B family protein [Lyngbya confervoides]MCM1982444.1 CoB--CoM heterodisulfide reductase iron-sulfur subunit B family protein [Lyngbya confervoides BDU141951]
MKYSYYPGCSLHSTAKEFDLSTQAVMEALGIELEELQDWSCCGGSVAGSVSHEVGMALSARNVVLAQQQKNDLLAACSGCYNKSARAANALGNEKERRKIEPILEDMGLSIPDHPIQVRNIVDVLANDLDLAHHIKTPLTGLRVVCYYGCLLTRPADITGWDSPRFPMAMDRIAQICGAEVADFHSKTKCCGGPILVPQEAVALELTKQILDEAQALEADCIVLACPLCSTNLELRQPDIEVKYRKDYKLPVIYITELIGLALGIQPIHLGLDKHLVSTQPLLKKLKR